MKMRRYHNEVRQFLVIEPETQCFIHVTRFAESEQYHTGMLMAFNSEGMDDKDFRGPAVLRWSSSDGSDQEKDD
jgi:hypothetical protein